MVSLQCVFASDILKVNLKKMLIHSLFKDDWHENVDQLISHENVFFHVFLHVVFYRGIFRKC